MRRENNKWSEKNKALVKSLEQQGRMTEEGRKKRIAWMVDRLNRNLKSM